MIRLNTNLFGTPTNQLPLAGCHTIYSSPCLVYRPPEIINPYDSSYPSQCQLIS